MNIQKNKMTRCQYTLMSMTNLNNRASFRHLKDLLNRVQELLGLRRLVPKRSKIKPKGVASYLAVAVVQSPLENKMEQKSPRPGRSSDVREERI